MSFLSPLSSSLVCRSFRCRRWASSSFPPHASFNFTLLLTYLWCVFHIVLKKIPANLSPEFCFLILDSFHFICVFPQKYYGLDTKVDERSDSKWGDIEQWMVPFLCCDDTRTWMHAFLCLCVYFWAFYSRLFGGFCSVPSLLLNSR